MMSSHDRTVYITGPSVQRIHEMEEFDLLCTEKHYLQQDDVTTWKRFPRYWPVSPQGDAWQHRPFS